VTKAATFGTAIANLRYITRQSACSQMLGGRVRDAAEMRQLLADQEERVRRSRKASRVCEKVVVALPLELNPADRAALVERFAMDITDGRAAWFAAIHDKGKDEANPHAHVTIVDADDRGRRVFNFSDLKSTERLREAWQLRANAALGQAGSVTSIDRRTLKMQRAELLERGEFIAAAALDREPTVHEGPALDPRAAERRARGAAMRAKKTAAAARAAAITEGIITKEARHGRRQSTEPATPPGAAGFPSGVGGQNAQPERSEQPDIPDGRGDQAGHKQYHTAPVRTGGRIGQPARPAGARDRPALAANRSTQLPDGDARGPHRHADRAHSLSAQLAVIDLKVRKRRRRRRRGERAQELAVKYQIKLAAGVAGLSPEATKKAAETGKIALAAARRGRTGHARHPTPDAGTGPGGAPELRLERTRVAARGVESVVKRAIRALARDEEQMQRRGDLDFERGR
jgi:hypothetical protein